MMVASKLTRHVAFLRGINVGGHKIIKMEDLGRAFTSFGFKNVRTYIASGNVLFESPETDHAALTRKIERELRKSFGYDVTVLLRTIAEVEAVCDFSFKRAREEVKTAIRVSQERFRGSSSARS